MIAPACLRADRNARANAKPRVRVKARSLAVAAARFGGSFLPKENAVDGLGERWETPAGGFAQQPPADSLGAARDGDSGRLVAEVPLATACSVKEASTNNNPVVAVPHASASSRLSSVPSALFRQEAIDFQQQHRVWGDVAVLQPISTKVMTWAMVAAVGSLSVFLCVGQYARKETVTGYLAPAAGTSKIFSAQQGTIRAVYVSEGQPVEEGQPLLTIDTSQIATDGADVNSTMLDALAASKDLLTRQIAIHQERATSEQERLTSLIRGAETEIAQLHTQITAQIERTRLSEEAVQAGSELRGKGYMADVELNRRRSAALEQRQTLSSLEQQMASRQNQLTETRYALRQLPIITAEKIQSIRNDLSALDLRIAELNGRRAYVIRSPLAGRVSTLQATVGKSADPHRLQMEIVPTEIMLQAELFVPTRAIGFVAQGQKIRIMYEAFPYQHFGTYSGRITKVSQTIVTAADATGPVVLKEPAYRVTAIIDRPDVDAKGRRILLHPDMLLRADLILEERPLIRWLLDPLLGIRM
jgi:membrane fusion protein